MSASTPDWAVLYSDNGSLDRRVRDFHPIDVVASETATRRALDAQIPPNPSGTPLMLFMVDVEDTLHSERCHRLASELELHRDREYLYATAPLHTLLDTVDASPPLAQFIRDRITLVEYDEPEGDLLRERSEAKGLRLLDLMNPYTNTASGMSLFEVISRRDTAMSGEEALARAKAIIDVLRGNEISESQMDALWQLFSTRFSDISGNMPLRLEETEEATRSLLADPRIFCGVDFDNSGAHVRACVVATQDVSLAEWISNDFLDYRREYIRSSVAPGGFAESFVPGLAAYHSAGRRSADAVLLALGLILAAHDHDFTVTWFECTDVSEIYIPRRVSEAAAECGAYVSSSVERVASKRYSFLTGQ